MGVLQRTPSCAPRHRTPSGRKKQAVCVPAARPSSTKSQRTSQQLHHAAGLRRRQEKTNSTSAACRAAQQPIPRSIRGSEFNQRGLHHLFDLSFKCPAPPAVERGRRFLTRRMAPAATPPLRLLRCARRQATDTEFFFPSRGRQRPAAAFSRCGLSSMWLLARRTAGTFLDHCVSVPRRAGRRPSKDDHRLRPRAAYPRRVGQELATPPSLHGRVDTNSQLSAGTLCRSRALLRSCAARACMRRSCRLLARAARRACAGYPSSSRSACVFVFTSVRAAICNASLRSRAARSRTRQRCTTAPHPPPSLPPPPHRIMPPPPTRVGSLGGALRPSLGAKPRAEPRDRPPEARPNLEPQLTYLLSCRRAAPALPTHSHSRCARHQVCEPRDQVSEPSVGPSLGPSLGIVHPRLSPSLFVICPNMAGALCVWRSPNTIAVT